MSLYVVKISSNDELIGVYSANNLEQLFWLVDECASPNFCDYAKLPDGGFVWNDRGPKTETLKPQIGDEEGHGVMMQMVCFGYRIDFTNHLEESFNNLIFKPMPKCLEIMKRKTS